MDDDYEMTIAWCGGRSVYIYLSSILYSDDEELECCIGFNEKACYPINDYRCKGHTIRAVNE